MIDSYEWGNAGILGCRHFLVEQDLNINTGYDIF